MPDKGNLRSSALCCVLNGRILYVQLQRQFQIRHPCTLCLPQKGHMQPRKNTKGSNEVGERSWRPYSWRDTQRPKAAVPRRKKGKNDSALTHKILFNQIDLEATQLFKFARRSGIRRLSLSLLQQTGKTQRTRASLACRVVKCSNRLSLAVASVPEWRAFEGQPDTLIYPYHFS